MSNINYNTKASNQATVQKNWVLVDAKEQVLGRLASQVAAIIRGKHKPYFSPHVACGDHVIVINASKVRLTRKKWDTKQYITHTGYPGGQHKITPREVKVKSPVRIIEYAVKGMLPKNKLGRKLFHHLFVYEGSTHAHAAQNPENIALKY